MPVRNTVQAIVERALARAVADGVVPAGIAAPGVELPKQPEHGDYATNAAMALAKAARKNPRELAQALTERIRAEAGDALTAEIAGPGFINLRVAPALWRRALGEVAEKGERFGESDLGRGEKVMVEFVSANPTGPLHVGHGRNAVTGDAVAALLERTGHAVWREYLINDAGEQVRVLGRSAHVRYQEQFGRKPPRPEDFYPGDYVVEIGRALAQAHGDRFLDAPESEWLDTFSRFAAERCLEQIRADAEIFGIRFDSFFSERDMRERGEVKQALDDLRGKGFIFDQDGAVWFRSTAFGDDKDRPVVKSSGDFTYLAADIAYHRDKFSRGFHRVINVWGADHHGTIPRMKGMMQALGLDPARLQFVLIQIVNLVRGGEPVKMGKRLGNIVTLAEVVDEVGRDATRFFFLMRRSDAQLDFDLEVAKKQSLDNPVFYVQYGHARLASILRKAEAAGVPPPRFDPEALQALVLPEELDLCKRIDRFPEVLAGAAQALEPHRVVEYLRQTIAAFHSYYTQYKNTEKVISDDARKTAARLYLCWALKTTLRNALATLGVSAPERMQKVPEDAEQE